jgi:hypothetical protein
MNNFFEIGNNKAFLGDCLDFMKNMEEKCVICLEDNPHLRILNCSYIHENCLKKHIKSTKCTKCTKSHITKLKEIQKKTSM